MDDDTGTLFALLDDGPTGLASSTAQEDYHGPGRGCGNSVNALLDGWLVTMIALGAIATIRVTTGRR